MLLVAAVAMVPQVEETVFSRQTPRVEPTATFARIDARLADLEGRISVSHPDWQLERTVAAAGGPPRAVLAARARHLAGTVSYTIDATIDAGGCLLVNEATLVDERLSLIDAWRSPSRVDAAVATEFEALARELLAEAVPAPR